MRARPSLADTDPTDKFESLDRKEEGQRGDSVASRAFNNA